MCDVALPIARKRKAREEEIDRCESHVKVMVTLCKGGVESLTHFFSLQTARCREDDDFVHCVGDVDDTC